MKTPTLRLPLPLNFMAKLMEEEKMLNSVANQAPVPCACEIGGHRPWWGKTTEPPSHNWKTVR